MSRTYPDRITLTAPFGYPIPGGPMNLYAVVGDPNGLLTANVGDRAFQVGSSETWVCTGGSVWTALSSLSGTRTQFLLRPSVAPNPALGTYATFAAAYAAAVAQPGVKTIYVQGDGVAVPIQAGVYDMSQIVLVGLNNPGSPTGQQTMTTPAGAVSAVFTSFLNGAENIILNHFGTAAPLATIAPGPATAIRARTGRNATWQSDGNAQPVLRAGGTGAVFLDVEEGSLMVGDGALQYEPLEVLAGATLRTLLYDNTNLTLDSVRGPVGATLERFFVGVGPQQLTYANFLGAITDFVGSPGLQYTPGAPVLWVAPPPTNVKSALDRIATALAPLVGGAIP